MTTHGERDNGLPGDAAPGRVRAGESEKSASLESVERSQGSRDVPESTIGPKEADHLGAMEKSFLQRPRLSIRLRIVAGFLLCFFLLAATGLINLAILYEARARLRFLTFSQDLSLGVQHARQLERTAFPNRDNLRAARESAKKASDLLIAEGVNILDVAGEKELVNLSYQLGHYVQVIERAVELSESPSPDPAELSSAARDLDVQSGQIMDRLRLLKAREATWVNQVLRVSQELPFIFGAVMLLIIFWITKLLANTITDALNRMEAATQRIVAGDYTLMTPRRGYRDELSQLALAVNRMLLELRAREAQVARADKLATVGALTAGMARQLAGGLEAVQTRVATVLGDPAASPPSPGRGALEAVMEEARRGRETIEGLLELALDEAVLPGPANLAELIESADRIVRPLMTSAGVSFRAELPESMTPVRGAFGQLRLVFVNLFYNAVQAMPRGGALTVRAGFLGGDRVEITVADQGVGIAREDLPHVLESLHSPTERAEILGPGLSVSHSVVRKLGGDIRVESVVGKGTTVHVSLPLAG